MKATNWISRLLAATALGLVAFPLCGAVTPAPVVPASASMSSTAAPVVGFDAFRLLTERNIFNPKRVGRSVPVVSVPSDEVISLVGTMNSDGGPTAFFDGTDANFRRTVMVGDAIDRYTVKEIGQDGVQLALQDSTSLLKVGQQLRRPPGGEWRAQEISQATPLAAEKMTESNPGIPTDASETLRRLMEKRQKQLNQ